MGFILAENPKPSISVAKTLTFEILRERLSGRLSTQMKPIKMYVLPVNLIPLRRGDQHHVYCVVCRRMGTSSRHRILYHALPYPTHACVLHLAPLLLVATGTPRPGTVMPQACIAWTHHIGTVLGRTLKQNDNINRQKKRTRSYISYTTLSCCYYAMSRLRPL